MGWETRRGRRYYYLARRVGDRVVKGYVGPGQAGEFAALLAEAAARRRAGGRRDRELLRARWLRTERVTAAADAVLAVWLPAAGLHRINRGAWRRERGLVVDVPMPLLTGRKATLSTLALRS